MPCSGLDFLALRFFDDLLAFTVAALSAFMTISSFLLFYNYDPQKAVTKIKSRLVSGNGYVACPSGANQFDCYRHMDDCYATVLSYFFFSA